MCDLSKQVGWSCCSESFSEVVSVDTVFVTLFVTTVETVSCS